MNDFILAGFVWIAVYLFLAFEFWFLIIVLDEKRVGSPFLGEFLWRAILWLPLIVLAIVWSQGCDWLLDRIDSYYTKDSN